MTQSLGVGIIVGDDKKTIKSCLESIDEVGVLLNEYTIGGRANSAKITKRNKKCLK